MAVHLPGAEMEKPPSEPPLGPGGSTMVWYPRDGHLCSRPIFSIDYCQNVAQQILLTSSSDLVYGAIDDPN